MRYRLYGDRFRIHRTVQEQSATRLTTRKTHRRRDEFRGPKRCIAWRLQGVLPRMRVAVPTAASSAVCAERFPDGRQRAFAVLS